MHEEAWAGCGSDPSLTRTHKARDGAGLVRENNDETSIKGNLLFCFMSVFHVRGQSVSSGLCISKRIGGIVALD